MIANYTSCLAGPFSPVAARLVKTLEGKTFLLLIVEAVVNSGSSWKETMSLDGVPGSVQHNLSSPWPLMSGQALIIALLSVTSAHFLVYDPVIFVFFLGGGLYSCSAARKSSIFPYLIVKLL